MIESTRRVSPELIVQIEAEGGCKAALVRSVTVRHRRRDEVIWESVIHVFDLEGHPDADRLYLRSEQVDGFDPVRTCVVRLRSPNGHLAPKATSPA